MRVGSNAFRYRVFDLQKSPLKGNSGGQEMHPFWHFVILAISQPPRTCRQHTVHCIVPGTLPSGTGTQLPPRNYRKIPSRLRISAKCGIDKVRKRQGASRPTAGERQRIAKSPALKRLPFLPAPVLFMKPQKIMKIKTPVTNRQIQSGAIGTLEPKFSPIKFVGSGGFLFIPVCRYNII